MRLVGALVVEEAYVAVNSKHRPLRIARERNPSACKFFRQRGHQSRHRPLNLILVNRLALLEPLPVLMHGQFMKKLKCLGTEAGERLPILAARLAPSSGFRSFVAAFVRSRT